VNPDVAAILWHGLVKTSEDLGVQSEDAVHQELLDWLGRGIPRARLEHESDASADRHERDLPAEQQGDGRVAPKDPENRLMARASRFRAPAMILRDVALAASGLLQEQIGGKAGLPLST
jgi:hypothetical protein